jgi:hypothetical protein
MTTPVPTESKLETLDTIAPSFVEVLADRVSPELIYKLSYPDRYVTDTLYAMSEEEGELLDIIHESVNTLVEENFAISSGFAQSLDLRAFASFFNGDLETVFSTLVSEGYSVDDAKRLAIQTTIWEPVEKYSQEMLPKNKLTPNCGIEIEFRLGKRGPDGKYIPVDLERAKAGVDDDPEDIDRHSDYTYENLHSGYTDKREIAKDTEFGIYSDVGEIAVKPFQTSKANLRYIQDLLRAGLIPDRKSLSLHINIDELKLDRENFDPNFITFLVWGEGYAGSKKRTGSVMKERWAKSPYPFHRDKLFKDPEEDSILDDPHVPGVEFRSLWKVHSFPNMVRTVEDIYWLSTLAKANQKTEKNEAEESLSVVWNETKNAYVDLLRNNGLEINDLQGSLDDFYEVMDELGFFEDGFDYYDMSKEDQERFEQEYKDWTTKYGEFLGTIRHLQRSNPEFRSQTRNIVIAARGRCKRIVKSYSEETTT